MTEKIIPDGYKLVAVKGLDELVYWLDRCKDKGHLENCADLIEPFDAFEYRNVSEEAIIAAHEAKAAPAAPQGEPDVWVREQRGTYEGIETLDPMFVFGSTNPGLGRHGATYSPRYPAAPSQEQWETSPKDGEQWETSPKPVALTDEDILHCAALTLGEQHVENCGLGDIKGFARAIIAALREKQGGV